MPRVPVDADIAPPQSNKNTFLRVACSRAPYRLIEKMSALHSKVYFLHRYALNGLTVIPSYALKYMKTHTHRTEIQSGICKYFQEHNYIRHAYIVIEANC